MTYCKIVLPKPCDNHGNAIEYVTQQFNSMYGGSTQYDGIGSWVSKSDYGEEETVFEPNTIVESYNTESERMAKKYMTEIGTIVKDMTNEMSIMVVVNHDAIFL